MTRDKLLLAKEYYSTFPPGSWVQVPRDGLLDGIAALEAAWARIDELEKQNPDLTVERALAITAIMKERDALKQRVRELYGVKVTTLI